MNIKIEGVGGSVILAGTAATALDAQRAGVVATRRAGRADEVVNSIALRGRHQLTLKVTVAEAARTIIKELGINLSAKLNHGNNASTTSFDARSPVAPAPGAREGAEIVRRRAKLLGKSSRATP